jgi:hypothetical protein
MELWLLTYVRNRLAPIVREQRGQADFLILALLVFIIFLIFSGRRLSVQ